MTKASGAGAEGGGEMERGSWYCLTGTCAPIKHVKRLFLVSIFFLSSLLNSPFSQALSVFLFFFSLLFCYLSLLCCLPQNCKQIFYLVSKKLHSLKISNNIFSIDLFLLQVSTVFVLVVLLLFLLCVCCNCKCSCSCCFCFINMLPHNYFG